ncbi:MAG TPA: hypothetical protein VIG48_04920 [Jatrophihabitans sp.]
MALVVASTVATTPSQASTPDPTAARAHCSPGDPVYYPDHTTCTWVVTDLADPSSVPTGDLVSDSDGKVFATLRNGRYSNDYLGDPPDVHYVRAAADRDRPALPTVVAGRIADHVQHHRLGHQPGGG